MIEGTAESGARSDTVDWVRLSTGLRATEATTGGGEDSRIPIEDDGTGVGYRFSSSVGAVRGFWRLNRGGDDEGSNAGSNRFTPETRRRFGEDESNIFYKIFIQQNYVEGVEMDFVDVVLLKGMVLILWCRVNGGSLW